MEGTPEMEKELNDLREERERILKGFHDPKVNKCGACGGIMEDTRDAICFRCSPEPEVQQLVDKLARVEEENEGLRKEFEAVREECDGLWKDKKTHVVNNPPLLAGKEHPLFATIKSEFSDAICEGVNMGKTIGLIHEPRLNLLSNEHAGKVIDLIQEKG